MKFIELLKTLEEREAQYEIVGDMFSMYLGNQYIEFSKFNKTKIAELVEEIEKYW